MIPKRMEIAAISVLIRVNFIFVFLQYPLNVATDAVIPMPLFCVFNLMNFLLVRA